MNWKHQHVDIEATSADLGWIKIRRGDRLLVESTCRLDSCLVDDRRRFANLDRWLDELIESVDERTLALEVERPVGKQIGDKMFKLSGVAVVRRVGRLVDRLLDRLVDTVSSDDVVNVVEVGSRRCTSIGDLNDNMQSRIG